MTKLLLFILLLANLFASSQKQWKIYKPASSSLLGYTIAYNQTTKELSPQKLYQSELDIPRFGADKDFEEFQKTTNLDLIGLNFNNYRISKITAKGKIYIDKLKTAENFPSEVDFIYSGLRSDSVEITYQRQNLVDIRPDELIDLAKDLAIKFATKIDSITFVDSIRFRSTGNFTTTIKNPNVYYLIQIAHLKRKGEFPPSWGLTFNEGNRNSQTQMLLKPGDRSVQTVEPRRSKVLGIFSRYNKPVKVWLEVEKDNNGKAQLYLKTNESDEKFLIPRNTNNNTAWFYQGNRQGFVTSYNINNDLYKILEIILDAKETPDGNILIQNSVLTYPEGELKIK